MSQRLINIGAGAGAGDAETLRSAFNKINQNFTELYDGNVVVAGNVLVQSVAGRIGDVELSFTDIAGAASVGDITNIKIAMAANSAADRAFTVSSIESSLSTGYVGSIGYTGSQGITGYTGSVGDVGYTGSIGYTGSVGIGYTGSIGGIGYTGSSGNPIPRANTQTTATTIIPQSSLYEQYSITALASNLSILSDSDSPQHGQKMVYHIKDDSTPRYLTFATGTAKSFREMGTTLPSITVSNKNVYIACIYNAVDSRWDVVAVSQEI